MNSPAARDPHVFLSYVHEDIDEAVELQKSLEAAGLKVWRDRSSLGPGDDWEAEIRAAITANALAFVGCFSENSENKSKSGMRDELLIAVEEIRARPLGASWFIPVRFADVKLPAYKVGGGRTLSSFQYEDLFGDNKIPGLVKVATKIRDLFQASGTPSPSVPSSVDVAQFRRDLRDRQRLPDVSATIVDALKKVRTLTSATTVFPYNEPDGTDVDRLREYLRQESAYRAAVSPVLDLIVAGCEWGGPEHIPVLTRSVTSLARERANDGTSMIRHVGPLSDLARLPALLAMCAGSIAAVATERFDALEAVTLKATVVGPHRGGSSAAPKVPAIEELGYWNIFADPSAMTALVAAAKNGTTELPEEVLLQIASNRVRTPPAPGSQYLYAALRPHFPDLDDEEFQDSVDATEVYLALLVADLMLQTARYRDPWIGMFAYRDYHEYATESVYRRILDEAASAGSTWPPVVAGLFGGSEQRVQNAAEKLKQEVSEWQREHRWHR